MIKTTDIELSKGQYFKLLARIRFSQSWYIYLLPFLGAVLVHFAMKESDMIVKFLVVYGLINPLWILVYLGIHVNSKKTQNITLKRHYEILKGKIIANHADGSSNEFLIENIVGVKQFKNEILLYFSKSEFVYLPFNSFSAEDLNQFRTILNIEK